MKLIMKNLYDEVTGVENYTLISYEDNLKISSDRFIVKQLPKLINLLKSVWCGN